MSFSSCRNFDIYNEGRRIGKKLIKGISAKGRSSHQQKKWITIILDIFVFFLQTKI